MLLRHKESAPFKGTQCVCAEARQACAQDFSILGCLRDHKDELAAACQEEVFKRQQEAADDWRTDKELAAACKARGTL